MLPEKTSPVQNELPPGSMATAKSPPAQPPSEEQGNEAIWFPFWSSSNTALESATSTSPFDMILTSKARAPLKGTALNEGSCVLVHLL